MCESKNPTGKPQSLEVHSLFESLQGESLYSGLPCFFIRLSGCSLSCSYCDTPKARCSSGRYMSLDEICQEAGKSAASMVEVTGGEPLEQSLCNELLGRLLAVKDTVLLETSGSVSIEEVPKDVHVVMDLKTPGSGMDYKNIPRNIPAMEGRRGELKIVVAHKDDFIWAKNLIEKDSLDTKHSISISPCLGKISLEEVAEWILKSGLRLRMQVQLHKIVWPNATEER